MSNELLNAYIRFGEPDGDDLDFSQIADWAGYLLQEQRERIAELEAENQRLRDAFTKYHQAACIRVGYADRILAKHELTAMYKQALEKET